MFVVSSPRRVKIEWLSASRKLQRSSRDCCEIRLPPGLAKKVFGVIGQHKRKGGKTLPFGNCCELLSSRKTLETSNCQAQNIASAKVLCPLERLAIDIFVRCKRSPSAGLCRSVNAWDCDEDLVFCSERLRSLLHWQATRPSRHALALFFRHPQSAGLHRRLQAP